MPLIELPTFLGVVAYGDKNYVQIVFGLIPKFVFHSSRLNLRGPNPILYRQAHFLFHQNDRPPSPCYVDLTLLSLRDAHPSKSYLTETHMVEGFFPFFRMLQA